MATINTYQHNAIPEAHLCLWSYCVCHVDIVNNLSSKQNNNGVIKDMIRAKNRKRGKTRAEGRAKSGDPDLGKMGTLILGNRQVMAHRGPANAGGENRGSVEQEIVDEGVTH